MSPADEQPFLSEILARYADDGPRLMYADYLDESGRPNDVAKAELIRVQVALAKLPDDHARRPELVNRQSELLHAHRAAWTAQLAGLGDDTSADFRRGLPDSVSIDAGVFLVRLLDAAPRMLKLVHCPFLAGVRELDLCGNELGNSGVNLLVRSPHINAIEVLDLGFNGLDDAGMRVLSRVSTLPGLKELYLNDNGQITGDGVRALAESPFFGGLTTLDISGNDVNDGGVRAIVRSPAFTRLRTLKLAGNHIGDAGVAALLGSGLLRRALDRSTRLDLRANTITHIGAELLAKWPDLARVVHLDLGANYLGDRGLAALLASPYLTRVRTLKLSRNQITDTGARATREVFERWFHQLRLFDLSGNRLTRHGLGILQAAAAGLPVTLDLSGNVQTATGGEGPVVPDNSAELKRRLWHPARRD